MFISDYEDVCVKQFCPDFTTFCIVKTPLLDVYSHMMYMDTTSTIKGHCENEAQICTTYILRNV